MSCYFRQHNDAELTVPRFIESSSITYYEIKVRVATVEWLVEKRFRDFVQLNDKLVSEVAAVSKKLLPPKKIVGNRNPAFLEQRREQLEKYLKELLTLFPIQLPQVLAEFLEFNKYDIIYLLKDLAKVFHESGEALLSSKKEYNLSALEVYAISERLCLPCPENVDQRGKYDFSHVLDFCTQLELLVVTPVKENSSFGNDYNTVDVPIGRSNIIPKNLSFNLNAFRNLKTLTFYGLSTDNIVDITLHKERLETICVHNTTIQSINQVLLCDQLHKDRTIQPPLIASLGHGHTHESQGHGEGSMASSGMGVVETTTSTWQKIIELNLTGNLLTHIDTSVRTAPGLRKLILEQNRIRSIQNLADLPHLQVLSLSVNLIDECIDWHYCLGNLVTLNLAQNKLRKLSGLRKLLSLVNLDLSCNQIDDLEEIDYVACLPLLETLRLTGNPLASSVDYRPRILARFHERAPEIFLDNEHGTQKELDTALVLSALLKSKLKQQMQNASSKK